MPAPYVLDENLSELVPVLHAWTGGRGDTGAAPLGERPLLDRLHVPRDPGRRAAGDRRLAQRLRVPVAARSSRGRSARLVGGRCAPPRFPRPEVRPPGRRTSVTTSACERSFDRRSGTSTRSTSERRAAPGGSSFTAVSRSRTRGSPRSSSTWRTPADSPPTAGPGSSRPRGACSGSASRRVDGRPVPGAFAGWVAVVRGEAPLRCPAVSIAYSLTTDQTTSFRPRQPTDGVPLPVLVTPAIAALAAPDGTLSLSIEGEPITARVVGIVRRFPSIVGDAVVADRQTAETVLDTSSPGLGTTNELWADSAPLAAAGDPDDHLAGSGARGPRGPTRSHAAPSRPWRRPPAWRSRSRWSGSCSASSPTAATSAASCSTSRRRAPHRHDPDPSASARAARRRVRPGRRPRHRRRAIGSRALARLGDGLVGRARAAAPARRRPGPVRRRRARLRGDRRAARRSERRGFPAGHSSGPPRPRRERDRAARTSSGSTRPPRATRRRSRASRSPSASARSSPCSARAAPGKSTLLRILAGLEQPSAGAVRVLGEEIGKLAAAPARGVPGDPARVRRSALHARARPRAERARARRAPARAARRARVDPPRPRRRAARAGRPRRQARPPPDRALGRRAAARRAVRGARAPAADLPRRRADGRARRRDGRSRLRRSSASSCASTTARR